MSVDVKAEAAKLDIPPMEYLIGMIALSRVFGTSTLDETLAAANASIDLLMSEGTGGSGGLSGIIAGLAK